MSGTRRVPQHSKKDSNALRASVFDVFLELGALDQNSKLAEWILNEETEEESSASISSATSFERTSAGSRYHERFDSFTLPNLEDDVPPRTAGRSMSRPSRFLNRMRSKSRPKKSAPPPPPQSKDDGDIPGRAMPKKQSILRFKSTRSIRRKAQEQDAPSPVPRSQSVAGNYGSEEPQWQPLFRSKSQPGPDAVSVVEEEWEELLPVSTGELNGTSEYNTFLRGAPLPESDVAGATNTHLFRSFSHSGKTLAVFPARRTLSHPEPPSSFPPPSSSLSIPPSN
ncbi:hypothetical protein BDZ89DRAFT_1067376 [Hymenopellis radicata]|nr:hypothetical protein BDZ89DRAFT_1067376 [Hymenopellis radicata]